MDAPLQMSLARFLVNIVAKTMRLRQIRQQRMMNARTAAHAQNPASLRSTARCSSSRLDPSKEAAIFSLFVVAGSRMNCRSTLSFCFTNLDAGSKNAFDAPAKSPKFDTSTASNACRMPSFTCSVAWRVLSRWCGLGETWWQAKHFGRDPHAAFRK